MKALHSPVGVYIHIPFCKHKCDYCAFVSSADHSLMKAYVNALIGQISAVNYGGSADSVYIGGGTPSCLYRGALSDIFKAVRSSFTVTDDCEITVECNPESCDAGFADECLKNGVNRISMGLQSSNDATLRAIGRIHSFADYKKAMAVLRGSFDNISTDIILGLPGEDKSDVLSSLDAAAEFCEHISVYALSVEEGTPLFFRGYKPDDDGIAELYDAAVEHLDRLGFDRYEVSNFAKQCRHSRHNLKYWRCEPYYGFGAAAHGYDGKNKRYVNTDSISEYIERPIPKTVKLSEKDVYNEYVMLSLRTSRGISLCEFEKRFGYSFLRDNFATVDSLLKKGYMEKNGDILYISPEYMFVMNGIIEELMLD